MKIKEKRFTFGISYLTRWGKSTPVGQQIPEESRAEWNFE